MSTLFGSAPAVSQQPNYPTITPQQQTLQTFLTNLFPQLLGQGASNVQAGNSAFPNNQTYAAPLTPTQTGLISQITGSGPGSAAGMTAQAQAPLNQAQGALSQILTGQPQNYSQYFQQDIAAPQELNFAQQTLPAIEATFAKSAGGGNTVGGNTGMNAAVGQATENLNQNLNWADTALQTGAAQTAQQLQSTGVGQAGNLAQSFLSSNLTPYAAELGAASLPQQTQQTQLTGQANYATNLLSLLSGGLGTSASVAGTPTTQQGNTAVTPGFPGAIPSIATGAASGMAGAAMSAYLASSAAAATAAAAGGTAAAGGASAAADLLPLLAVA